MCELCPSGPCGSVGLFSSPVGQFLPICMLDSVYLCERGPVCICTCEGWCLCVHLSVNVSPGHRLYPCVSVLVCGGLSVCPCVMDFHVSVSA